MSTRMYYPRVKDNIKICDVAHLIEVNIRANANFFCLPRYTYQWLLRTATTTQECPTSLKSFRTHSPIDHSFLKWKRTMGLFGNSEIALLDGILVYHNIRDIHTYSTKS